MQVLTTTTTNTNAVLAQNKHRQSCSVQFIHVRSLPHTVMRSSRSPLPNNLTYLWKRLLALRPYWQ